MTEALIKGLYGISERILALAPSLFFKIEPHEAERQDSKDFLWLSVSVDEDSMSEGDLIHVSPYGTEEWYAGHDFADKFGGWPTVWSMVGSEYEILTGLTEYLQHK